MNDILDQQGIFFQKLRNAGAKDSQFGGNYSVYALHNDKFASIAAETHVSFPSVNGKWWTTCGGEQFSGTMVAMQEKMFELLGLDKKFLL